MAWQLSPLTRSEEDRRELIVWAVECAERLLPTFEQACPDDRRPREGLEGARAFARDELRIGPARALAAACHAAARQAPTPAAVAAARACGHATAVAHMASHARGLPYYGLRAVALEHPDDPKAVEREDAWQRAHLPERFTSFVYPEG